MPIALVAAAVLVLQSVFSAWALGATQPMLDAFGNPLCITSADGHSPGPSDHSKLPNCCALGCMGVSHALPVSGDADVVLVHPIDGSRTVYSGQRQIFVAPADHNPGSPRAPPQTF